MNKRYSPPKRFPNKGDRYYSRVYCPVTGRRTWVSCETDNKKAARAWVDARQEEVAHPERARAAKFASMKFKDALDRFLEEKQLKKSARRHLDLQTGALAFWEPHFGDVLLGEIDEDAINGYLKKRKTAAIISPYAQERKAPRRPPGATTLNNDLADLHCFFRFCLKKKWIREDPTWGIEKFSGEVKRRRRSLSVKEEAALLKACRAAVSVVVEAKRNVGGPKKGGGMTEQPRRWSQKVPGAEVLSPYVITALRCGFRRRTLCSIRWEHLSFETATWRIEGELLKMPEDYEAPCPRDVVEELRAYRARLLEKKGAQRVSPTASIFGLQETSNIGRLFHHAAARAGLPAITMHDLRRCYLNALKRSGVNLETAMVLTAHKSLKVVREHYLEIDQEELREAVRALEQRRPLPSSPMEGPSVTGAGA